MQWSMLKFEYELRKSTLAILLACQSSLIAIIQGSISGCTNDNSMIATLQPRAVSSSLATAAQMGERWFPALQPWGVRHQGSMHIAQD